MIDTINMTESQKVEAAYELSKQGYTQYEAAKVIGITESVLNDRLQRLDLNEKFRQNRIDFNKNVKDKKVIDLYLESRDISKIKEELNLSSHYIAKALHKAIILKEIDPILCGNCNKPHDCSYASGRFCSETCARVFANKDNNKNKNDFYSLSDEEIIEISKLYNNRTELGRHFNLVKPSAKFNKRIENLELLFKSELPLVTKEQLEEAIVNSTSYTQILENLGFNPKQNSRFRQLKGIAVKYGVELPKYELSYKERTKGNHKKYTDEEFFVINSNRTGSSLRHRMINNGVLYKCCNEYCLLNKLPEMIWAGQQIVLQVDHINGISTDNRLENLRFICANCHSQTLTFAGRSRSDKTNKIPVAKVCSCGRNVSTKYETCPHNS